MTDEPFPDIVIAAGTLAGLSLLQAGFAIATEHVGVEPARETLRGDLSNGDYSIEELAIMVAELMGQALDYRTRLMQLTAVVDASQTEPASERDRLVALREFVNRWGLR